MGNIISGYLFPHPPIIIEEIGRGEEKKAEKTIQGARELAHDISIRKPDTIIVITSHGPLFRDAISISVSEKLEGDFGDFGNRDLSFKFNNNLYLTKRIIDKSNSHNIPIANR